MNTTVEEIGDVTVLVLEGSLDAQTASVAGDAIHAELEMGRLNLVLHLSGVGFMSSAGLRVILAGAQEARSAGGDLRLAEASSNVERVLRFSGFTKVMQYFDSKAGAVESYAA